MEDSAAYWLTSLLPVLEFVDAVDERALCARCGRLAVRPWRARNCGHLLCWRCLNAIVAGPQACPLDGASVTVHEVVLERRLDEEARRTRVRCPFHRHGCGSVLALANVRAHLGACHAMPVYCPNECGRAVPRRNLVQHLVSNCWDPKERTNTADDVGQKVDAGSKDDVPPRELDVVLSRIEQLATVVHQLKAKVDSSFHSHRGSAVGTTGQRSDAALSRNGTQEENADGCTEAPGAGSCAAESHTCVDGIVDTLSVVLHRLDRLDDRMALREAQDRATASILEQLDNVQRTVQAQFQKLDALAKDLNSKRPDGIKQEARSSRATPPTTEEVDATAKGEKLNRLLMVALSHDRILSQLVDQLQRPWLGEGEDGQLVWKVVDYARRKRRAATGAQPELYSPPFYTSRYGYKMCLRIYLNGYGDAAGRHLSFYVCLMKGPYDDLLDWPFRNRFTLSLLDQSTVDRKTHVSQTLDPGKYDLGKWSLKPATERNVGFGLPEFIELDRLERDGRYLRHDCLYLSAVVHADRSADK